MISYVVLIYSTVTLIDTSIGKSFRSHNCAVKLANKVNEGGRILIMVPRTGQKEGSLMR